MTSTSHILIGGERHLAGALAEGLEVAGLGRLALCPAEPKAIAALAPVPSSMLAFVSLGSMDETARQSLQNIPFAGVIALAEPGLEQDVDFCPERNVFLLPVRLGAILERSRLILKHAARAAGIPPVIDLGPFHFHHADALLVPAAGGQAVRLTDKERDILLALYRRHPRFMPRKELLGEVWGYADGVETHTLETHIYRLRRKIDAGGGGPSLLVSSEGGYGIGV